MRFAWKCHCGKLNHRYNDYYCVNCGTHRDDHDKSNPNDWPWNVMGTDLRIFKPVNEVSRVVACLNVYNDQPALEANSWTWLPWVDHILAVDGRYGTHDESNDGTIEYLRAMKGEDNVTSVVCAGMGQIEKRTTYLRLCRQGDLMFIVDADEIVSGAEILRTLRRVGDVGWVRKRYKQTYRRHYRMPRLIYWREGLQYYGRHHWIWYKHRIMSTHQYMGPGYDTYNVPILITNSPKKARPVLRKAVRVEERKEQADNEAVVEGLSPSDYMIGAREHLQICQITPYDPGMVVYRLHSAINTTTPHSSIFFHSGDNKYHSPIQYTLPKDREMLKVAAAQADVVHNHLTYQTSRETVGNFSPFQVIHHHGTMYRESPDLRNAQDTVMADLVLVSNLELLKYGYSNRTEYLPNPIPVRQYRNYAEAHPPPDDGKFYVGHSPSKRDIKGTESFLQACKNLKSKGVPVEPVLIEGIRHARAVRYKAQCHAFFDSFWLGIQCSGLEAAAMGMPVIAGDEEVYALWGDYSPGIPYLPAFNVTGLELHIANLYECESSYKAAATNCYDHVLQHHDYAAVALQYLEILDKHMGWRLKMTKKNPTKPST